MKKEKTERLLAIHNAATDLLAISFKMQVVRDVGGNLSQLGIPAGNDLNKVYEDINNIINECYKDLRNLYEEVEND